MPPLLDEYDALVKRRPGAQSQELLPSELFRRQGFCAGPLTQSEVDGRHRLGIDNLMFGTDYPHPEGTYPNTQSMIDEMFADVNDEETHKSPRQQRRPRVQPRHRPAHEHEGGRRLGMV